MSLILFVKASRRARSFQDRQSVRWLEAAQKAGQIGGAARVTVVADREADMFEFFAHRPAHVHLLVRAMHDRVLMGGGKLALEIASGPRLSYAALDLPARPGRSAREAQLSVRFGRLDLRPGGEPQDLPGSGAHGLHRSVRGNPAGKVKNRCTGGC